MGKKIFGAGAAGLVLLAIVFIGNPIKQPTKYELLTASDEKQPKPEFPGEAAEYWASHRTTPNDENPDMLNLLAVQEVKDAARSQGITNVPNLAFDDVGPGNYGGRIRGIVVHPTSPDTILVGGVMGGIMKTENGGLNWRITGDFLPSLAISYMVIDPDDNQTVYAGTGEGFFNIDAARGIGILRSDDFGETWTLLPSTAVPGDNRFHFVNRLDMIPGTDVILAATRQGIFRSADNGVSWTEVSGQTPSGRGFVDLKVDPANSNRIYAVHFGSGGTDATDYLMRSDDGGLTWLKLGAAEGLPVTNIGRIEIDIGSDGVIYASCGSIGHTTRGLWRSPAGGAAFAKTPSSFPYIERQAWYDLMIGVDPSDSDRVYMGAVDVSRTTDAGATIGLISDWSPASGAMATWVHADIHDIAFHPDDPMTLWIVCDGGVFKSTNGGDTFIPLNNDLRLTQYYGMDVHPDGSRVNGGTQDNGSHLYYGDEAHWPRWFGGDGGFSSWDQQQPGFVYGATPGGGLFGSANGGSTTSGITLPSTAGAPFITPFTIDHNDGNRFLVGTDRVFYSENIRNLGTATFVDASGSLGTIRSLAFNPHDADTVLAGTNSGNIHISTNITSGSPSFTQINNGINTTTQATWIEVDPFDLTGNTYYATFSGYGDNRIYKTTDGGANWTSIHGDLPQIPVYCISVARDNPNRLYIGTEIGAFTTADNTNGGAFNWEHITGGMAFSRIVTIRWTGDHTVWFATHGRGIWKATYEPASASLGTPDDSECDADGYLDIGETVMLPVTITNNGIQTLAVTSLTLSTSSDVTITAATQDFGEIAPGNSATVNYEVTVNSLNACPETISFTADINYTGGNQSQTLDTEAGVNPVVGTGTYQDDAEGATLLMSDVLNGNDGWSQVQTQAHTGNSSWYTTDEDIFSDKVLTSPWIDIQNAASQLSFWLFYDTEEDTGTGQVWDGAILEIRTESGPWEHVVTSLPYDSVFFDNMGLVGQACWGGLQTTWRQGTFSLADFAGQAIQFRFRFASDSNTGGNGFWIDDIEVTNAQWLQGLDCDEVACITCFPDLAAANQAVLDRLNNWPATDSILDYVSILNNVCLP